MTRMLTGVCLLALTGSLFAALQLPEPRLITIPELSPAAYRQDEPGLTWDGENFIAVWTDQRKTAHWRYGVFPSIYSARVSAEGAVLDPIGIELVAQGTHPRIASNENGSLLTYQDGHTLSKAVPLGRDGRPSGDAVSLGALDATGLASDGLTYCVIASRWPSTNKALILNREGRVLQTFDIEGTPSGVAALEGRYIVLSARGQDILATIVVANRPTVTRIIASSRSDNVFPAALAGGNRVLVAWVSFGVESHSYEYLLLDASLKPIGQTQGPQQVATSPNVNHGPVQPSLGWDGELFLLSWGEDPTQAVRIHDNGAIVRNTPVVLDTPITAFASAFGGNTTLLLSIEPAGYSTDVYARVVPSFRALPALPERKLVALTARPQMQPALAYGAGVALAVSLEGDGPDSITATLFSPRGSRAPLTIAVSPEEQWVEKEGASVAILGDTFLVAWREMANFTTRIRARRIAADGRLLGDPILIAVEPSFVYFGETSVATDGQSFLVTWDSPSKEILARRVAANGTLPDSTALVVSRNPGKSSHDLGHPEALWSGNEYLVVWSEHEYYTSAPPAGMTRIRGARITAGGSLVDAQESKTYFARAGHPSGIDLASNSNGLMLVAAFTSYISLSVKSVEALPLDRSGNATASAPLRLDLDPLGARLESPAVAGVGKSFVAFWTENNPAGSARVRGACILGTGDVERFDVVAAAAFSPAVASAEHEVVLVQSQHDSVGSNVVRLFSTTFSVEGAKRQRAVRP